MLARSPEPETHDKVLDNNSDRIEIWKCWFMRRGENCQDSVEYPDKNLSEQGREPTTNSNHYDAGSGNRTRETLVGGERSQHYASPDPLIVNSNEIVSRPLRPYALYYKLSINDSHTKSYIALHILPYTKPWY